MARRMSRQQQKAMFARLNQLNISSNRLPVQYSIIVPSTNLSKKDTFLKRINSEKIFMDRNFGGDTSVRSVGSFIIRRGKKNILIKEKGAIIESSTTKKVFNSKRTILKKHIIQRQKQWKQNSILFKIEGETFIHPRQKFIAHDRSKRKILIT